MLSHQVATASARNRIGSHGYHIICILAWVHSGSIIVLLILLIGQLLMTHLWRNHFAPTLCLSHDFDFFSQLPLGAARFVHTCTVQLIRSPTREDMAWLRNCQLLTWVCLVSVATGRPLGGRFGNDTRTLTACRWKGSPDSGCLTAAGRLSAAK